MIDRDFCPHASKSPCMFIELSLDRRESLVLIG